MDLGVKWKGTISADHNVGREHGQQLLENVYLKVNVGRNGTLATNNTRLENGISNGGTVVNNEILC